MFKILGLELYDLNFKFYGFILESKIKRLNGKK